jgi:hypothetical protein
MLRASLGFFGLRSSGLLALTMAASLAVSGCRNSNSFDMSHQQAKWVAAKTSARQELTQIPPPLKSVYLSINQEPQWQNPFLSVEQNMIQLRIYLPDENGSPIDRGGITRLSSARKQVVNVRLSELPRALASLPNDAWPYGRVVAIGREKGTSQTRTWFPNHLDVTVRALQDMGVVVDDWNHPVALP